MVRGGGQLGGCCGEGGRGNLGVAVVRGGGATWGLLW